MYEPTLYLFAIRRTYIDCCLENRAPRCQSQPTQGSDSPRGGQLARGRGRLARRRGYTCRAPVGSGVR